MTAADSRTVADRVAEVAVALSRRTPAPAVVFRVGLGMVILLAGVHKLVDPGAWSRYLAPAFARPWPFSIDATMIVAGVSELPFGLALVVDRYATAAAAVVAVSLVGTSIGLAVLVVQTGRGADVLLRDLGLAVLAVGVTLECLGKN